MRKKIVIVDYGMGNLRSVVNAFDYLGANVSLSSRPQDLGRCQAVVVPGQGAFRDCLINLRRQRLTRELERQVIEQRKPYLGICLGMQILGSKSFEGGEHAGLNWIAGEVKLLQPKNKLYKIPHLGWNDVKITKTHPLFSGLSDTPCFYFAHSYVLYPKSSEVVTAITDYGGELPVALAQNNIMAVQFHPEKSQQDGLQLLRNFMGMI